MVGDLRVGRFEGVTECVGEHAHPVPDDHHVEDGVAERVLGVGVAALLDAGVVNRLVGVTCGPGQVVFAEVGQTLVTCPLGGS